MSGRGKGKLPVMPSFPGEMFALGKSGNSFLTYRGVLDIPLSAIIPINDILRSQLLTITSIKYSRFQLEQ